jgi:ASCH domain.
MKAISLKEPWASLMLEGKKTIETRVWKTNYRGKLLLCASKNQKRPYLAGHSPLPILLI